MSPAQADVSIKNHEGEKAGAALGPLPASGRGADEAIAAFQRRDQMSPAGEGPAIYRTTEDADASAGFGLRRLGGSSRSPKVEGTANAFVASGASNRLSVRAIG